MRETLTHQFVEFIPPQLEEGVLYVSTTYTTAVHRCFCGCGREVVTPLSPTDWKLIFDGDTVSLAPSIGSWGLPCRSHYWITQNRVRWSEDMTQARIDAGRARDRDAKAAYYNAAAAVSAASPPSPVRAEESIPPVAEANDGAHSSVNPTRPVQLYLLARLAAWLKKSS